MSYQAVTVMLVILFGIWLNSILILARVEKIRDLLEERSPKGEGK